MRQTPSLPANNGQTTSASANTIGASLLSSPIWLVIASVLGAAININIGYLVMTLSLLKCSVDFSQSTLDLIDRLTGDFDPFLSNAVPSVQSVLDDVQETKTIDGFLIVVLAFSKYVTDNKYTLTFHFIVGVLGMFYCPYLNLPPIG
jgi:hypothetical protein